MDLSESMASPSGTNSSTRDPDLYHTNHLKNQIKLNEKTIKQLEKEIEVQKKQLKVKDEAIESAEDKARALEEHVLDIETDMKSLRQNERKWGQERKRLMAQMDAANNEADRLNQLMIEYAGNNSEVMNGSMEDAVRLHNQLSQSRRDIQTLKSEIKSLENLVKAKDDALEQHAHEFAKVEETMASKKEDQNTIADLRRQIQELRDELGGEHRYGKMTEGEIEELRSALADKTAELESAMDRIEAQKDQVQEAKLMKANASEMMAKASEKMAQAVEMCERAVAAEAERMRLGGFVRKDVHDADVRSLSSELEACKKIIESMNDENMQSKRMLNRILETVDGGLEQALSCDNVAEKFGNSVITIQELRHEIKSLHDIIISKEGALLSLKASRAASDARAQRSIVASLEAKQHLAKAITEFDYTLLMNEPPPSEECINSAMNQLVAYEDAEQSLAYSELHKEQLRLQAENISLSKTIEDFDTKMEQAQQKYELALSVAISKAAEDCESQKERCREREEEILQLQSAIDAQVITLEQVRNESRDLQQENNTLKNKTLELEELQAMHDTVVDSMEQKNSSLMAEIAAVKTFKEAAAAAELSRQAPAQIEEPVLIHLNIEIKDQQNIDNKDMPVADSEEQGDQKEEEDPVTPRQSKVFESHLEESPQKQFVGAQAVGIVSPEALSQILDSLIVSKKTKNDINGEALYHEAIEMLQGELSRLSLEMASDNDLAAKLRNEVGDLNTARLSAKTTAEILESYNAMSMKLAAHKAMAAQRENVFARHEQQMLNEISDLRMEIRRLKGKSALKSVKKAFSSTVRGIKKSLDTTPKSSSVNSVSPLGDTLPSLDQYSPSPRGGH